MAAKEEIEKIDIPPTPPLYTQEDCANLKQTINSFKLTEMNKKMNEFTGGERFKALKSDMEQRYTNLNCDEYLRKLAAGEIPAPQTAPDKNPALLLEEAGIKTPIIEKAAKEGVNSRT